MSSLPLISCLMVTCNRGALAQRAVECFRAQTYPNKELVIIDDGTEDYGPMLAPYRADCAIHYHRIAKNSDTLLGGLRNLSLDAANGDLLAQWDDDEWYHPDRLRLQADVLLDGYDVTYLANTLVHVASEELLEHLFRTGSRGKTVPGTVMHRPSSLRYENVRRGEDATYLAALRAGGKAKVVPDPHTHLFIRCFHGNNTWERDHFIDSLSTTRRNRFNTFIASKVLGDIRRHPSFRLTDKERDAAQRYLADSRRLGLVK